MPETFNPRIFIVDDDVVCRNVYTHILKQLGYEKIHLFDNGNDCFMMLDESKPDIVFLDYNMEELDGIDVLKQIKKFDADISVVFISGQEDIEVAVKTMRLGAIDYIVKANLDIQRMKAVIERIKNPPAPGENVAPPPPKSFIKRFFPSRPLFYRPK